MAALTTILELEELRKDTAITKTYKDPIQETNHDKTKEELCYTIINIGYSFLKQLPAAASFLHVITTLVSFTAAYFGKELVLHRISRNDDECLLPSAGRLPGTPTKSDNNSSLPNSRKEEECSSSRIRRDHLDTHSKHQDTHHSDTHSDTHSNHPLASREQRHHAHRSEHMSTHYSTGHTSHRPRLSNQETIEPPHQHADDRQTSQQAALVVREQLQSHSPPEREERGNREGSSNRGGDPEHLNLLKVAAECLHAQDYGRMRHLLSGLRIDFDSMEEGVAMAVTFGLGQANYKLKHYTQAESFFKSLVGRAMEQEEERGRAGGDLSIAHYYLGEINFARSKYDEAARQYRTAIEYHSLRSNVAKIFKVIPPTRSGLWAKLAAALRNSSKVMDAIAAYREAIETGTAKKDRLAAHTSLGNLLQNAGENAQAVEEYTASISLSEELKDNVSLGWAHGNIGNAYLGLNYRDKAIYHLKLALELTLEHEPTPAAIGRAYNNLGTAYQALNELDQAQEYYDLSLAQAIYGGDRAGQARVYGNIGNLQMLQKKYDGSIAHYTETLNTTKDKSTRITAHHNRGCASYEKAESEKRKFYVTAFSSIAFPRPPESATSAASAEREARKLFTLTYHGKELEGTAEEEHKLPVLPSTVQKRYRKAMDDLLLVVDQHELSFQHIKGSRQGLTLSVSLFETNSRTFHRLLDSHYNVGEWEKALVYAEQSRARTLGELLLERKRGQLEVELKTPLDMEAIERVVGLQELDVMMVSYTGSRLLVWVLSPQEEATETDGGSGPEGRRRRRRREVRKAMFQVALEENGFEGKSLDYYLHYILSEELVERNVEMYAPSDYQTGDQVLPILRLHELFAKPLLKVMSCLHSTPAGPGNVRDVIFIPDSYINLLPLVALLDKASQEFLGDSYRFRIMPSLLSMGILNQMPPVRVIVPHDGNKFCVVGNPTIPTFSIKGKTWSLGKLPFATEEAEWVSYILGCSPTLHEQATKSVVLMMIASARMVHIATHGSAASGFLAFASLDSSASSDAVSESSVLIYPEDIEKMVISPALVVLSSCDSGRGTVKADGVLGMARAFLLAGAQAVMTTLWRVPDESAAVFMKFFYQYFVDGYPASVALQKAMLSVRSFSKYSGFVHWSGYQLTGREVSMVVEEGREGDGEVRGAMGGDGPTVFPRLDVVQLLERDLIVKTGTGPSSPRSDVQVVYGSHGLNPAGPVRDFVLRNHGSFPGGVYWLNSTTPHLLNGGLETVTTVCLKGSLEKVLVVLDGVKSLPRSEELRAILNSRSCHIIVISYTSQEPEALSKEIDQQLIRGSSPINIQPLSTVHTTQKIVHAVMSRTHFTPLNREQRLLERMAYLTAGCPGLVNVTSVLLQRCMAEAEEEEGCDGEETGFLDLFASRVPLLSEERPTRHTSFSGDATTTTITTTRSRTGSFKTDTYLAEVVNALRLPPAHEFVLRTLSIFAPLPIPLSLTDIIQHLVMRATQGSTAGPAPNSISNLLSTKLLRPYPSPVVRPPSSSSSPPTGSPSSLPKQEKYLFVPQLVQDALWEHMDDTDTVFSITTAYKALQELTNRPHLSDTDLCFATGLSEALIGKCDTNRSCIDDGVYKEVYKLLVGLQLRIL